MSYPLGTTAAQLSQAVGEGCLISNAGTVDLFLAAGSYAAPNAFDVRLPVGSSLQWGGGTLWGVAAGPGGAYAVLYTPGGVGGGVVNGATVPVPPSAAAIGAAVGGSVPVPPSAAAIGAAVPVPPSATAIGAAVAAPGAGAIATSLYNQGTRPVDAPSRVQYQLFGGVATANSVTFDVSQANTVDVTWRWTNNTARTPVRGWGLLRLEWLDNNNNVVQSDGFELANERLDIIANLSHKGSIRIPALGSQLRISFVNNQVGANGIVTAPSSSATADTALVDIVFSSRTTDRARYFPALITGGSNADSPSNLGVLFSGPSVSVAAGATASFVLEPYSGPIEVHAYSTQTCGLSVSFGATEAFYGAYRAIAANQDYSLTIAGVRSQLVITMKNTSTAAAASYLLALASDS